MSSERLVIVDGVRTPFCKAGTDLAALGADELGRIAVSALLTRTDLDPALIDEVIFGCVAQPADAVNIARVIALRAGIPQSVPAVTVHRNCASGCEALTQAHEKLCAGRGSIFVVGGTESMSNIPLLFSSSAAKKFSRLARAKTLVERFGAMASFRPPDFKPRIGLLLGLTDPVCGLNMGETAEILARESGISRARQDEFALESHQRATAARERHAGEICPVFQTGKNAVTQDNGVRENQSLTALAGLKPQFDRRHGTVTAGNAAQITDGAVALLVMGERRAQELGFSAAWSSGGLCLCGLRPGANGARAGSRHCAGGETNRARARGCRSHRNQRGVRGASARGRPVRRLRRNLPRKALHRTAPLGEIPAARLNVNGGAIALGHPVGATGARLVLTALQELKRRNGKRALVSLCIGGGQGAALWLERI